MARSPAPVAFMMLQSPSPNRTRAIRTALLTFFDARQRDLPWRRSPDPYRVWVSEVMLQQTRVDAVIPYYERWLARFPTLRSLAEANPDEVLRAWEGLGYYSRARNLQHAARRVMEQHHGELPDDPVALRALPGIGDYTSGAIASIAFGRAEPAVDGNARRVLCRLFDLPAPAHMELRSLAAQLVPADRPAAFNQGLMELGATLCSPRNPSCLRCPLRRLCQARARGTTEQRPVRKPKKAVPTHDVGTAVVTVPDGSILLARRPDHGLLAGLWEFPGQIVRESESVRAAATRAVRSLLGVAPGRSHALGAVEHAFSHRRETYHVFRFSMARAVSVKRNTQQECDWVHPTDLVDYTLPAAQRRIARLSL